jgi:hypothetical protein
MLTESLPINDWGGYTHRYRASCSHKNNFSVFQNKGNRLKKHLDLHTKMQKYKGRCLAKTLTCVTLMPINDGLLCRLAVTVSVLSSVRPSVGR